MAKLELQAQRAQVRRTVEYPPSVWGDYFINQVPHANEKIIGAWKEEAEVLKEEVRKMLTAATDKPSDKLNMIDAVQRLGIAYHFEKEIEEALEHSYNTTFQSLGNGDDLDDGDLSTFALRFRLLRQHGYNVSSETFNRFKDGKGNFKESLVCDVEGILSLYEASYYSVPGEDILDEALAFAKAQLKSITAQANSPLAERISHALRWPILKDVPRKGARQYVSFYQQQEAHNETLLKLAKLDFNILQKLQQKELKIVSEWWKNWDVATKLPFVRDRVPECYFLSLALLQEPQFTLSRIVETKIINVICIFDDIYDTHGTIEELELFTKTIERWDTGVINELPDFMKLAFEVMLDFHAEIEKETALQGRSFCVYYAKEALKNQVRVYMAETRWFNEDCVPTLEEYMSVATESSGYPLMLVILFCGMGEIASKEVFDWLLTRPKIWYAGAVFGRLKDDTQSNEHEQKRGHVASAVECYMKQYGASREQAHSDLNKLCANSWKIINEELLKPTNIPRPILTSILNFLRLLEVMYEYEDGFTYSELVLKDIINALFVDPIAL